MKKCGQCGASVKDGANFCSQCGKPILAEQRGIISWKIEIPLITNPFVLRHVGSGILALVISMFVIFGTVLGIANGARGVGQGAIVASAVGAFFFLIAVFTLLIFLGNKYCLEFMVGGEGIVMISQKARAHALHRLTFLMGLLAKNMAVTGAGLLGISTETTVVPWNKVRSFKCYPEKNVIAVRRRLLPPIYVYCTADNFKLVTNMVTEKAQTSKTRKERTENHGRQIL